MSYYEKPEYWCIECGIEINEPGFCYQCKKERKAEYDAELCERACWLETSASNAG